MPTIYTHIVATEIVSISGSNGEAFTLTSLQNNSSSFTIPDAAFSTWPLSDFYVGQPTGTAISTWGTVLVSGAVI